MLFESFQELEYLDLIYGGQLAACERQARRAVAHIDAFAWGGGATRGAARFALETMAERVSAMDILDLLTKFSGLGR
jgi:hypothetical protein